jgi:hypothetical protein
MSGPLYNSYEAATVGALVLMLANSATFQLLVGVTTATAALGKIVEVDSGDDLDNAAVVNRKLPKFTMTMSDGTQFAQTIPVTNPFGWVQLGACVSEDLTPDTYVHHGDYTIGVTLPYLKGDRGPWRMRAARNTQGLIRKEFLANRVLPGAIFRLNATCHTPVIVDDTGPWKQTVQCAIEGEWGAP